jgi:SnoaL-like domain
MNESELRAVRDRLDIAEVMTRYAMGVDTRSSELLRACFADEVEVQASSSGRLNELFKQIGFSPGLNLELAQWVKMLAEGMAALPVTQHLIGNHLIEITGDQAHLTCYLRAMHFSGTQFPGSPPYEVGGYYRHILVRTAAGWKIRKWTLTCTWETGDPSVLLG